MSSEIIEILSDDSDRNCPSDDTRGATSLSKRQRLHSTGSWQRASTHFPTTRERNPPVSGTTQWNYIEPIYVALTQGFIPTWDHMLPNHKTNLPGPIGSLKFKAFQLSLLSVSDFTITGLPTEYDRQPTSVSGLRPHIKQISRSHGKATWERNPGGSGGRWRIPLGAYHALYAFLKSDPMTSVDGIPELQLKIASLGRARLEKGYPSAEKLISEGVPSKLAYSLASFQRGGVDFLIEKGGRALIADEMGLGKSVQAIAGMTVYAKEWPLLVLCPSGARYHWESEFQHWLCGGSTAELPRMTALGRTLQCTESVETTQFCDFHCDPDEMNGDKSTSIPESLLEISQIHVLGSAKDSVFRNQYTRVVICSYGLAPRLISDGKINPGEFQCIIVDESHMLKNKGTKRTSSLLPILKAAKRVVLLSGTPAFARPTELWPQLAVLGTERHGWWQDEAGFFEKYAKGASASKRAELHTMLTGTVMIRRMKAEILKSLPQKIRERATVKVSDVLMRKKFKMCMKVLRQGKGSIGDLARAHTLVDELGNTSNINKPVAESRRNAEWAPLNSNTSRRDELAVARIAFRKNLKHLYSRGMEQFRSATKSRAADLNPDGMEEWVNHNDTLSRDEFESMYRECMQQLSIASAGVDKETRSTLSESSSLHDHVLESSSLSRKTVLNHMYSLTGKVKISVVVEMLKRWLDDPTKGKLCIFAHHVFVLDAIVAGAGLQNIDGGKKRYIRVDGSTTPKSRQAQIDSFQSNPSVRIALLGITAAGVAVTLTAASTVWFAELFWTPALMIQAEDRCHRIGQQARVRCLYIVARGTLDDFLWKLMEKKFRDLGEFVEGKERMKMVVHRTHDGEKELFSFLSGEGVVEEDVDDPAFNDFENKNFSAFSEIDHGIENDIEELGRTEQLMVRPLDPDEDDANLSAKSVPIDPTTNMIGRTKCAAICLSDDEEELGNESVDHLSLKSSIVCGSTRFPRLRIYKMLFSGPNYGLEVAVYRGRIIVKGKHPDRSRLLGETVKPDVGHVLVAVSGRAIPILANLDQVLELMQLAIASPPAEIMFAEDAEFAETFASFVSSKVDGNGQGEVLSLGSAACTDQKLWNRLEKNDAPSSNVIDLLEDA